MNDVTLKFLLLGEDRASKAFKSAGESASESGSKMKRNYAAGVLVAATAVAGFAKLSVDKFKEVGGETLGLMRVMGGTAESASRLRFAAQMSGVSFETLQKSTGKFSKALDAARGSAKGTAAMVKMLGTDFLDAHGHILPMDQLLPRVSDKFAKMPSGAEKTALAMKLFGKAGADMLPFLNKGSTAISGLIKESDKYGLTLTGKNLDALKKSKASQREWNASLDGLRVQFGAQILPLLNTFVGFLRDHVIPMVTALTGFLQKHSDVAKILGTILGTLVVGLKALAIAQGLVNTVMAMNPIGLVVVAIAALTLGLISAYRSSETFRRICHAAFHAVADAFMVVVTTIVHGAATAFGWVPGLGGKLRDAARQVDKFRDDANRALNGITTPRPIKIVPFVDQTAAGDTWRKLHGFATRVQVPIGPVVDQSMAADVWRQLNGFATRIQVPIGPVMAPPPGRASGGPVRAGMSYIVGEKRAELFVPDQNGRIIPSVPQMSRAHASSVSGDSSIPVQIIVQMDGRNVASSLERISHAGPPLRIRVAS